MKLTWPRFFLAFFVAAFVIAIPVALHAEDGHPDSQVARQIRAPQDLFAADATAPPAAFTPTATVSAPATVTVTAPPPPPPAATPLSDFAQWAIGLVATALSGVAGWALTLVAAKFHIDAKGAALTSVTHLVDEGIDWVRKWAIAEAGTLLDQDNQIARVFNIVWPLAKPFIGSLGWDEDKLKAYLGTRLAPVTP